ncbi:MAG: PHP-associated domain-containing protein [Minisyncoccales bacterium]
MKIKIDIHCHSYYSIDAVSSPYDLIKSGLSKGINGIALTDHDTTAGWSEGKKAAKKLGALFIPGQEIKVFKDGKKIGEVLGLFLEKEIKSKEIEDVLEEIKEQKGISVFPHPFHFWVGFKDNLSKYLGLIDGIEVFNSKAPFSFADKKALSFAKKFNLALLAGSDSHSSQTVGNAYTFCEGKNLEDFKKAILEKKTNFVSKKNPFYYLTLPTFLRGLNKLKKFFLFLKKINFKTY